MNRNIVAIIQARMGSTRLPGKVLLDICGKSMLLRVVERVQRSTLVAKVMVATSDKPSDDPVVGACDVHSTPCFRGSEADVLDRYYQTAKWIGADVVVRITADCPLVDPEVMDLVIASYLENSVDYSSNRRYRGDVVSGTYPDGLDTEVFSFEALRSAWEDARLASEREHVTPFIWKNPGRFRLSAVQNGVNLSHHRWTVDQEQDLEFVRAIYTRLGERAFAMADVLRIIQREPQLALGNSSIQANEGYTRSLAFERSVGGVN